MRPSIFLGPALLATTCRGVPYEQYILAPTSRNLVPPSIYQVNGSVTNADGLTHSTSGNDSTTFHGPSSVTVDFGRNVGGIVSLDIGAVSASDAFLGVTFTESSLWISSQACDATADAGFDSPLWFAVGKSKGSRHSYTAEKKHTRGAFRYLTLVSNTTASVSVRNVRVEYTAAPAQKDLRAYAGYFHSNDELLNRIWYAGAYTNQLCTIDPSTGDALPFMGAIGDTDNITLPDTTPWYSNYTITNGSSTLTDGAKRDRLLWPGDMSIAVESVAVSTGDLYSVRTALETLFAQQKANGRLPYASHPFPDAVSFTYHLHSLVGMSYYYRLTGDRAWLANHWGAYKRGIQWALSSMDISSGLANITASSDWLRFGMGGQNVEANAILYFVLNQAQTLAQALHDKSASSNWTRVAAGIKSTANQRLWDSHAGLYRDNETTTTLHPQDGNAWAIKANLTLSSAQCTRISSALRARWGPYGAPAPEAGSTVSPFIGGFEVQAHFLAGDPHAALALMRRQWGNFMLDDPRMTNSTFIEGYATDGSLRYAPYANTPRLSHAHGWSTGPTAALTFYAAGLQLTGPAGARWRFAPQPADLREVDAGFETRLGVFSTTFRRRASSQAGFEGLSLRTPNGTMGDVELAGTKGSLLSMDGQRMKLVDGGVKGLKGGVWHLQSE